MSHMGNPNSLANLEPYKWKKGQSGNPAGSPKTRIDKSLKLIVTRNKIKERYSMTRGEIDEWEQRVLVLTIDELKALTRAEEVPAYAKGLAVAILTDMKNGLTRTISQLRERQYGGVKQKIEVTGADGRPLIEQPRNLTPAEAKALIDEVVSHI